MRGDHEAGGAAWLGVGVDAAAGVGGTQEAGDGAGATHEAGGAGVSFFSLDIRTHASANSSILGPVRVEGGSGCWF